MYFYNKNILEYAHVRVTKANSRIRYTEDQSIFSKYRYLDPTFLKVGFPKSH